MDKVKVLILGSGGREHALAWKLSQSPILGKLFIAPGNAGTLKHGTNIALGINDFEGIKELVLHEGIKLILVGPEEPLVNGIYDYFLSDPELKAVPVIGPSKAGAVLEGSKDFAKQFMARHGIPTAAYQTFTAESFQEGVNFLHTLSAPFVLKADGLAAGKGVLICKSEVEAVEGLRSMLLGKQFGQASSRVVIEEFLDGIELSVFALTDGKSYLMLPEAKDYKRAGEADSGPNTGGMGSVSPVPFADPSFMKKVEERIIAPTVQGLREEGITYCGFIFAGLMNVNGDPYVIEYNVRLGDPETEVVLPRIKSDFLEILLKLVHGKLNEAVLDTDDRTAACVILTSGGYPGDYEKGKDIRLPENGVSSEIFHAGTRINDSTGMLETAGGRVIAVSSRGENLQSALEASYRTVQKIEFEGMYYRHDIGFDLH
jgi:phosphoribosylamine--glycine ligase